MSSAIEKYSEALRLYETTRLTLGEISKRCGVTRNGLSVYIQRNHRELMYKRNGMAPDTDSDVKVRQCRGQNSRTHQKYKEAITACDSIEYIDMNISQIARMFNLDGTALANQLRMHYPDVMPHREAERRKRGLADNVARGPRKKSHETYAAALEMLRTTDKTIEEAASDCDVSFTGLRQYMQFYHKDVAATRTTRRENGKNNPQEGKLSGNGRMRVPDVRITEKYAEEVRIYRETSLTIVAISKIIGVGVEAFKNHLRMWHRDLMFERRNADAPTPQSDHNDRVASMNGTKRYSKASAEKYAPAIDALLHSGRTTEDVAREYGLSAGSFRAYIKEHAPLLWSETGMTTFPDGSKKLKRSAEKYAEAIELYRTTDESLRSIARRLNLCYSSVSSYIRRNCR